jgi:hypothetical protein
LLAESRIEVVKLVREVRGSLPLENVESYKAEGCVLMIALEIDVLARHDAHVCVECQVAELALAGADRMGGSDAAIEIEDGGGIAAAEEVEVEMRTKDVGGARDGLWSSRGAAGRYEQWDSHAGESYSADACRCARYECPA